MAALHPDIWPTTTPALSPARARSFRAKALHLRDTPASTGKENRMSKPLKTGREILRDLISATQAPLDDHPNPGGATMTRKKTPEIPDPGAFSFSLARPPRGATPACSRRATAIMAPYGKPSAQPILMDTSRASAFSPPGSAFAR